jgi:hypothetical protein
VSDNRNRRQKLEAMARSKANLFESQNAIAMMVQMDSETDCPGCNHGENFHVAGMCYRCATLALSSYCGWSILGTGNAWGFPAGWHHWSEA